MIKLHLDALSKLIDEYKTSLKSARDLYNYQQNILILSIRHSIEYYSTILKKHRILFYFHTKNKHKTHKIYNYNTELTGK